MAKKRYAYTMTENQMKDFKFFMPIIYFITLSPLIYFGAFNQTKSTILAILIALIAGSLVSFVLGKITVYLHNRNFTEID